MNLRKDSVVSPLTPEQKDALNKFVKEALSIGDGSFTPLNMRQCGNFLWVLPHNNGARLKIKDFIREYFPGENPNYAAAHPAWLEKYFK